jgi:fumarate hydratase class II
MNYRIEKDFMGEVQVPADKMKIISAVCNEIIAGKLDSHFPLVIWQTGSGTHTNMNCNEVIANRSHVLLGNNLIEGDRLIHPIDDVNKSQSSNDTFSSAMHIASYKKLDDYTIPVIELLINTLSDKSLAMDKIIKIGRTHLMDATPLSLGQEFSGYVSQLKHGIKALRNTLLMTQRFRLQVQTGTWNLTFLNLL